MKHYVVAHEFQAEEDVELTVFKGEVLCATEGVAQDGWMKVEVTTDARRRGFVPTSYLREITAAEAAAVAGTGHTPPSPAAVGASASTSPLYTPQRSLQQAPASASAPAPPTATSMTLDGGNTRGGTGAATHSSSPSLQVTRTPEYSPAPAPGPAATASASGMTHLTPAQRAAGPVSRHLLENPNAVVDAFMKNEVYFNQLMQRRASALTQMQAGLEEAMTEVAACKDRSAVLTRKLRDLDEVVERERRRWMERVAEEKAHVSRAAPYSAPLAMPASTGTTPVRSPISGRHDGPGRSVLEEESPRRLRA